jgi:transcriptional regulator with XRE-family HTH domain
MAELTELAERILAEVESGSYRDFEAKTGVSRGSLENLAKSTNKDYPTLETLDKLATYWRLPLWRVVEMAGINLGLAGDYTIAQQISSLVDRLPAIGPLVQLLLCLQPADLRGVVAYLEAIDRLRQADEAAPGPDQSTGQ